MQVRANLQADGMVSARRPAPRELDLAAAAALSPDEILSALGSRPEGLTSNEVEERLRRFGSNALAVHRVRATAVLFRQIRNPILILLLGAALVSGLTGGGTNAVIISVIVVLSVGLGFFNEYRAERAMASLRAQIRQEAEVRRNGQTCRVPVTDLVPGDVVALRIGSLVPADLRLLDVDECECDESILTGESMPVVKSVTAVSRVAAQDQPGCAFMGTIVHEGSALGVVVQTGPRTAFGRIAAGLSEHQGQTAFEVGLSRFSRFLFGVAALLTVFIFAINVALSRPLIEALLFSLAIAVGIAPEMMPAIVTVSLSSGSKALAAKKVLVKRLVAIEDLGNIEILFTDKTGTLTEGLITFERSLDPSRARKHSPPAARARLQRSSGDRTRSRRGECARPGPLGCSRSRHRRGARRRRGPLRPPGGAPVRPRTATGLGPGRGPRWHAAGGHERRTRGGSRALPTVPDGARSVLEALFSEGARVVAVATRPAAQMTSLTVADEQKLELAGFLTFADRPKADAGASIAQLKRLGVDVKIITGDNGLVAAKVCSDIGRRVRRGADR